MPDQLDHVWNRLTRFVAPMSVMVAVAWALPCASLAKPGWQMLPGDGAVDYQLGGAYPPEDRVSVVVRDSTAEPSAGRYNICYVNVFQTQPGRLQWWLSHHPNALLRDDDGNLVADPGWPDEYVLDTRTEATRVQIADAARGTIELCAAKGFDAVEFDNLDSWTRFETLTVDGNIALATTLVDVAHGLGLAAGQKNAPDLGARGPGAGFDFVISEECAAWDECGVYRDHYGANHIDVEYDGALGKAGSFAALCKLPDQPTLTVLRDHDLLGPGQAGYVFELCSAG